MRSPLRSRSHFARAASMMCRRPRETAKSGERHARPRHAGRDPCGGVDPDTGGDLANRRWLRFLWARSGLDRDRERDRDVGIGIDQWLTAGRMHAARTSFARSRSHFPFPRSRMPASQLPGARDWPKAGESTCIVIQQALDKPWTPCNTRCNKTQRTRARHGDLEMPKPSGVHHSLRSRVHGTFGTSSRCRKAYDPHAK